jgi:hypothetical protein
MEENPFRISLASLLTVVTTACVVCGFWAMSPDGGEWNLLFTATAIAFLAGLLTLHAWLFGMLGGAGFIVVYLLTLFQPDPSGLGPLEIVIPIQLAFSAIPMALAAWLGRILRAKLSLRR